MKYFNFKIPDPEFNCAYCGVRYACSNIDDDLQSCDFWFKGNGYGSKV